MECRIVYVQRQSSRGLSLSQSEVKGSLLEEFKKDRKRLTHLTGSARREEEVIHCSMWAPSLMAFNMELLEAPRLGHNQRACSTSSRVPDKTHFVLPSNKTARSKSRPKYWEIFRSNLRDDEREAVLSYLTQTIHDGVLSLVVIYSRVR